MKVLFIGGTGLISTAVTKRAIDLGIDLYLLNRGNKLDQTTQKVQLLKADIYQVNQVKEVLKGHFFDAVVQWIAFNVDHVKRDYELFKAHTKQYVFISTASAYQKPVPFIPITEAIPLNNPYWSYSQHKKYCEDYLLGLNDPDFNVTIIRPSHTYDDHSLVFQLPNYAYPYTLLARMKQGKPLVLVGDGHTKWTLTHHADFACAFLDILGNSMTYQQYYHLTSEKVFTWNEIANSLYKALHKMPNILYIPYAFIQKHFPELEGPLKGDNMYDAVFDNSKIKKVAPHYQSTISYLDVAKKAVDHYLSHPELQVIDEPFMKRYDAMVEDFLTHP